MWRYCRCLNKIDLPNADPDNARSEIEDVIGIDATDAIVCSAKTGLGIDDILGSHCGQDSSPKGNPDGPLRAMIIDSWYDSFVGVVMLVRVVDGRLGKGERIKMMASGATYNADNLGVFTPRTSHARRWRPERWVTSLPGSRNCRPPRWEIR